MEIWKDIPGYEGKYQASSEGKVRSLDCKITLRGRGGTIYTRNKKGKLLKPKFCKANGYLMFPIAGQKTMTVHRAVALAFWPNPANYREVNHKNGIKLDNRAMNLEWASSSQNRQHAFDNGLQELTRAHSKSQRGSKSAVAKLDEWKVLKIREDHKNGVSQRALSRIYKVSKSTVGAIVHRQTWTHI